MSQDVEVRFALARIEPGTTEQKTSTVAPNKRLAQMLLTKDLYTCYLDGIATHSTLSEEDVLF